MSMQLLLDNLKQKEATLLKNIQQSLANHNGLLGMLQATKDSIEEVSKAINFVAPESALANGLNIADNVLDGLSDAVAALSPEDGSTAQLKE